MHRKFAFGGLLVQNPVLYNIEAETVEKKNGPYIYNPNDFHELYNYKLKNQISESSGSSAIYYYLMIVG